MSFARKPTIYDMEHLSTKDLCEKYRFSFTTAWRRRNEAGIKEFGPPDCITKLSETDKAYIAGLIDADGYITIKSTRKTAYPNVGIGQADMQALEWLAEKTQATVSYHTRRKEGRSGFHRKQMIVRLHGRRAQVLCKAILPYLKIKRRQAEIVLKFICDKRDTGLSNEVNRHRKKLQVQIQSLNSGRRGKCNGQA